jgi:hypothetical protein
MRKAMEPSMDQVFREILTTPAFPFISAVSITGDQSSAQGIGTAHLSTNL